MNDLLLLFLRRFPIDYGKNVISKLVKLPSNGTWVKYKNSMNTTYNLNLSEYQMKQIYLLDLYEKNTIYQLKKLLNKLTKKPKVTVMDVGANIGFYALTMESILTDNNCTVHAFEPNPYTYKLLEQNVENNNKSNIILNKIGLSSEKGSFELTYNEGNLGTASIYAQANSMSKTVAIQTIKLDDYCKENKIDSIDVLKVDIEGAELDFFKGAREIISQSKTCIIIAEIVEENCIRAGYSASELYDFIIQLGFDAYLPKPFPFPLKRTMSMPPNYHDNLIFIKRDR
ncbi:MAG: FkbM family methyltransferase [Flavobacteriales bacterium]|nr:FkbM family methyltransferase [Flavobacteriales bacterium]